VARWAEERVFRLSIPSYRNYRGEDLPATVRLFSESSSLCSFVTPLSRCSKQDLSACVVDAAEDTERHFSGDDLRQLFKFNEKTVCDTHDTFKCKRCRDGKQVIKAPALLYGDASR
jgi:hypothetical protein